MDSIGIGSAEELVRSGAEQAFLKLKERYPNVCLVHLYALEGAVCNVEFSSLPESRKKELKGVLREVQ
nr:TfoX/Sxy family DNA transformation protein [uncultured Acetatifactor sp.]